MSIMSCNGCGCLVDTDAKPEAFYIELPNGEEKELDFALCDYCKDKHGAA